MPFFISVKLDNITVFNHLSLLLICILYYKYDIIIIRRKTGYKRLVLLLRKRASGMAYGKLRDMLELAIELQSTSIGLSIQDLMEKTGRSRKTVERMLAGLRDIGMTATYFSLDEDHHRTKRWRLKRGIPEQLLLLSSQERSALERHVASMPSGVEEKALRKLLASHAPLGKYLAAEAQELIDRTAYIGKVGPTLQVDQSVMSVLENGILGFQTLKIKYRALGQGKASWRIVEPLGLLFGRFGYLVANNIKTRMKPLSYRLDLIEEVERSEKSGTFQVPHNWDFKNWAEESFGIFHGDRVLNVKLRFSGEAARRAEKIRFHSSQTIGYGRRQTLIVKLRCKGARELIHELCHPDWIGQVIVEEPEELKEEYQAYLNILATAITMRKP